MTVSQANQLVTLLTARGVSFEPGLSENEIAQLATTFGVVFPPDLRLFLAVALPVSPKFAPWRQALQDSGGAKVLQATLAGPLEGMVFDVRVNAFWRAEWGPAPAEMEAREQIVRQQFPRYPRLIPIYAHRYLPALPPIAGNPVFSVHQTDIIYYGNDLAHYFANEFRFKLPNSFAQLTEPKNQIAFWDTLTN